MLFRSLIASLVLDPADGAPTISMVVAGEALQVDEEPPSWNGPASLDGVVAPGLSGTARFTLPAQYSNKAPTPAESWPATLSGTLTWACGPYSSGHGDGGPGATIPVGPAPAPAMVEATLEGVDWKPISDQATCDEGGVHGDIGTLQGYPFSMQLSLREAVVGGRVNLSILMDLGASKSPPGGLQFTPNWGGEVTVRALGPAGVSGRVEFTNLATGVDPANGPAPTGWPTTISGSITWNCAIG